MAGGELINAEGNVVSDDRVEAFRTGLRGEVIRPGDPAYDEARRIWNATIDKHPGIIARCSGVADVVDAVNFARENELLVAVRGGGHNVGGRALCEGGMVIDLSRMKGIHVDAKNRTASKPVGLASRASSDPRSVRGIGTSAPLSAPFRAVRPRWRACGACRAGYTARLRANIRFRFHAMVTSLHSPRAASSPRSRNCRNPSTDLMMPNTGSGVCLRRA